MSYFRIPSGTNLVLNVLLGDGATNKYPLAYVYRDDFSQIAGSPFLLGHISQGLYSDLTVSVPDGRYVVIYIVYDDAMHTIKSLRYNQSTDTFDVNDIVDVNAIAEGVWQKVITGNTPAGSFGEALLNSATAVAQIGPTKTNTDTLISRLTAGRAGNLDNLDAAVSSRSTSSSAANAVWEELQSAHTGAGTFGKFLDAAISSRESEASAALRYADDMNAHINTQAIVSSNASAITAIKAKTDQISFTGGNVNSNAQVVSDKTGYALSVAALGATVNAIWNEPLASHTGIGSTGAGLASAATDVVSLADAVWDELRTGHVISGSYGEALQGVLSVARATKLDNLDAAISSRESEASAASRAVLDGNSHATTQGGVAAAIALIGSPVSSVSADIAAIKTQTNKIGTPVAATLALDLANVKSDVALVSAGVNNVDVLLGTVNGEVVAVKAKTDQFTFTGPNVNANVQVMGDKTGYELSGTQASAITNGVWDVLASSHVVAGTFGKVLQIAAAGANPSVVAGAVWDELFAGHTVGGSFSDLVQAIRSTEINIFNQLTDSGYGLSEIRAAIPAEAVPINATLAAHAILLNAIPPAISAAEAAVISEVNANEVKIDAIIPAVNAAKANVISEVNANEVKIDAIQASIGTLSNNTTVRFIVPERLIKPTVGSKNYQFHLRLYDDLGNPEAPDSAPTLRIRRLDTGVDVIVGAAMTQDGIKVGAYYYTYSVAVSSFIAPILVEATIIENGITRYIPAVSEITEFETDLTALSAQVTTVDTKVNSLNTAITDPGYGLAALKAGEVSIIAEVNANEVKIDGIKAVTDVLPVNIATVTDVNSVTTAVNTKPSISDITTQLNIVRDNIKGADARDNTVVYNHLDMSAVAKTADPRFANLDATVSSRSTLTATQVWAAATRTLTSYALQATDIQAIWDYLAGGSVTVGSIGKLIKDNLDVKVSTRAQPTDIIAPLVGVAQEATVSAGFGAITNEVNDNEILINSALTKVNSILAKANLLPTDPASQSAVLGAITAVSLVLADTYSNTATIKASTNNLPIDPAREATVSAIPQHPLLASDLRLNTLANLDAAISSVIPADISNLATKADVLATQTSINNNVDSCKTEVTTVQNATNLIKLKTDGLPASPSSVSDVTNARDSVIARIDANGTPLTANQVWSYGTREITQNPALFGPDISGLAEKTDLENLAEAQYSNRMSTVFNSITGTQEIIVWAEKNGLRHSGTNATVTVKDSLGVTKWTATLATPNADGIFRFENSFSAPISQNYYIVIDITVDSLTRTSVQSFFTVV